MQFRSLIPVLLLTLSGEAHALDAGSGLAADRPICLQPLGPYDADALAHAARGVTATWMMQTRLLPPRELPPTAWYAPRNRWRADRILDVLDAEVLPGSGCRGVVGFTSADISTTKEPYEDWGIFGLGTLDGTAAVVSTFRLGRKGVIRDLLLERVVQVVTHEIGHNLGLDHCPTTACLMEDAMGTIRTVDRETGRLCEGCRERLQLPPETPPVP